jgi:putative transposase
MTASQRRAGAEALETRGVSQRRACVLVGLSRSGRRYRSQRGPDEALEKRVRELARKHGRYGYLRVWALLRREGQQVNRKRVHRLWRKLGLQVPRRRRKKRYARQGGVPLQAQHPNHVWTWDFVYDTTADGRTLRCLTVADEFTREGLAIRTQRRFPAVRAVEVLAELVAERGAPVFLRSDNGPEFIAAKLRAWLAERGIRSHYIEPGSPWQNAYGESFNGKFRDECLNLEVYDTTAEAQAVHERFRQHYNTERPHSSLGYATPVQFRDQWLAGQAEVAPGAMVSLPLSGPNMRPQTNGRGAWPRPHVRPPASALGSLSSVALSSAQALASVPERL